MTLRNPGFGLGRPNGMPPQGMIATAPELGSTTVDREHVKMVGFTVINYSVQDPDVVTENQMRDEHGYPARCNY